MKHNGFTAPIADVRYTLVMIILKIQFYTIILYCRYGTSFDGEEGVKIIVVGVGPDVRRENLEQLASFPTNSTVLIERDVTRIGNGELKQRLVDLVCNSEYRNAKYFELELSCN